MTLPDAHVRLRALPHVALRALRSSVLTLLLCALPLGGVGCAERAWQRGAEMTLEMTRIAVDGSWSLTLDHQRFAEEAALQDAARRAVGRGPEERQTVLEDLQGQLLLIRQRHHVWYEKYGLIRSLHTTAVAAFEAYRAGRGSRGAFLAALEPLLDAWRALQEVLPNRGRPDVPPNRAGESAELVTVPALEGT